MTTSAWQRYTAASSLGLRDLRLSESRTPEPRPSSWSKTVEPDLMLLDLYLPDIFGLDLLNQMRVQGLLCDVIVISAGNESKTVQQAVQLGVTNYLLKPFTLADLQQRLDDYRLNRASIHPYRLGDQSEIDRLFGRPGTPALEQLPKGMSRETATADPEWSCPQRGRHIGAGMCRIGRHIPGQCSPLPRALHQQRADERHTCATATLDVPSGATR